MNLAHLIIPRPSEKIVFFLRRHPLVFLGDVALIVLLLLVPVAVNFILTATVPLLVTSPFSRPMLILLGSIYYLMIWLFFMTKFVDYYLDSWIVTNDKILNVEQQGLFSRTVSELELAKIQDVTSAVNGVIPTIFNFGNVYVQTAGEKEYFIFEQVPHPDLVRKRILDLVEACRPPAPTQT